MNVLPFPGRARDLDLAAEQAGDLAADGEPEPGAAVPPARRPVRLLEGLEMSACLSLGIPIPVSDTEKAMTFGLPCSVSFGEARGRAAADVQRDASLLRELERVRQQVLQHLLEALRVGPDRVRAGPSPAR